MMINKPNRIIHDIVFPVAGDCEICYLILMFVEDGNIVETAAVKIGLKINYIPFDGSTAATYYTYSIN
jgi:hypothetical protein